MRSSSSLFLTAAYFLSALPAQESPARPNEPLPPQAAAATTATARFAPTPATTSAMPAMTPAMAAREAAARARPGAGQPLPRVMFDRPRADGPLWAIGSAWKASFDGSGFTAIPYFGTNAPRNFPMRFELTQATVGGQPLVLADGEPLANGNSVRTPRGALTEVVDTSLEQLEQSFVFDALPSRGAIAVDVRITSELAASATDGGLRFANEHGHVDYQKAVAVDAAGKRLPLSITWNGTHAHIEIPASFVEQAQLPLVLDPVLTYWYGIASGQVQLQHDSDVASFQSLGGRTLIIYQRQWSLTDQDCWGVMFDGNLGLVQTDFTIDFTTEDWLKVAVASSNYSQNFLVVAESRIGLLWFIAGRTIAANAAVGSQFDIERDGVVGSGGNNFHPDVGGDPYYGVGRYCVVFNKRTLTTSDIYMRQVTTAGALVTTSPIAIDTATTEQQKPSISKSCGQSNGLPAYWFLTWQTTYPAAPNDQEVWGRFVNWNGAVPNAAFGIGLTIGEETAPSACSPIDANSVRYWPVAYELASSLGQPRDIVCRLYRADNSFQASFTASNNVPGSDDREPEVDADGTRFVVCMTTGPIGGTAGVEAVTTAFLPGTNSFRVDERTGLITSSLDNYGQCNIVADYSGGSALSPRYFLSFTERTTNTFRLEVYGGHVGGNSFSTVFNQCGNLSIAASGSPVIGQSVTFTVGSAPFSGTILGFPGYIPLNVLGCNCWQGVDQGLYLGNPLVWTVPNNPIYVGYTLSVQGWSITGSQCLGFVDLSDTIDFTIR